MSRTVRIAMIVGLTLALGMTAAMAGKPILITPNVLKGELGTVYHTDEIWAQPSAPVQDPNQADGGPTLIGGDRTVALPGFRTGPTATTARRLANVGGSALPAGGSAMSSPRQRADRQIAKLIHRLN